MATWGYHACVFLPFALGLSIFTVAMIVGAQLRPPIAVLDEGLLLIFTTNPQRS